MATFKNVVTGVCEDSLCRAYIRVGIGVKVGYVTTCMYMKRKKRGYTDEIMVSHVLWSSPVSSLSMMENPIEKIHRSRLWNGIVRPPSTITKTESRRNDIWMDNCWYRFDVHLRMERLHKHYLNKRQARSLYGLLAISKSEDKDTNALLSFLIIACIGLAYLQTFILWTYKATFYFGHMLLVF